MTAIVGHQVGYEVGHRVGHTLGSTLPAPIALGAWWWEANADYLDIDVGVRDWTDRVNGLVVTQATGTAQPAFDGAKVTFSSASSQVLQSTGTSTTSMIGNKPFVASFLTEASSFAAGQPPNVPRLYLQGSAYSYIDNFVLTFSNSAAKQVLTFGHDGSNVFARRNGASLGSAAKALSALTTSPWCLGQAGSAFMTGDIYDAVLADASSWGSKFQANLDAIENFLLGRL